MERIVSSCYAKEIMPNIYYLCIFRIMSILNPHYPFKIHFISLKREVIKKSWIFLCFNWQQSNLQTKFIFRTLHYSTKKTILIVYKSSHKKPKINYFIILNKKIYWNDKPNSNVDKTNHSYLILCKKIKS